MSGRLQGQVAVITGASRGLGAYCALGFAREGAKVAIAARTEQEQDPRLPGTIHHTAKLIEQAGGEALAVVCNVGDPASVEQMTRRVADHWGRIDILMNNAAIQPPGGNKDISPKHWELIYRINVHGPFHCIRAALPIMQAQAPADDTSARRGNVINISSGAVMGGSPYGATKRALEAMTVGFAAELQSEGIVVNALKPVGAIETPGFLFAQVPRDPGGAAAPDLPAPDSYVEAAVLLALQNTDFTGHVHNDAEVIGHLADDASKNRFKAMNPDYWSAQLDV